MKPVFLEFCGINSFSEPAKVDFEKLLEFGIFGIFGDTGSGKSTILDCIGFALYGNVARSRSGSIAEIIHYSAEKAYVHFVFEIVFEGSRRAFRVERELKRKNAAQTLKVYEKKDGRFLVLADSVREGNALLERIIGLEQKDFEKCIALPQGEFAQFVKSSRGDRLKLVSRLFNLEAYGEGLLKRAGGKMAQAKEDLRVAQTKLEQYAGISAESNASLKQKVEGLTKEDARLRTELASVREQEKLLAVRVSMREEQEKLLAKFAQLEEQKDAMRTLSEELERLGKASVVVRDAKEVKSAARRVQDCGNALTLAVQAEESAKKKLDEAMLWDASKAEADEQALSDRVARAKSEAFRIEELQSARKKLADTERKIAEERNAFADFSYEKERERIEKALSEQGSSDFLAYAEQNGKAELLHAEYAVFADELTELTKKHPSIGEDSRPLIEKYTTLSVGGTTDLTRLRRAYEASQAERERLQKELISLEKAKGRYDKHLSDLQTLSEVYTELKGRIATLSEGLSPAAEDAGALETQLLALRRERKRRTEERETAQKNLSSAQAKRIAASEQARAAQESAQAAQDRLLQSLAAGKFSSCEEAETLTARYGDPERAQIRVQEYKDTYAAVRSRLRELSKEDLSDATQEKLTILRAKLSETESKSTACARELAVGQDELVRSEEGLRRKADIEKECFSLEKTFSRFERLRKLLEGNKFMEFVAEEYLQTVAENASGRLLSLTDGRYFLRYESGFFVGDNFNAGNLRGVYTLSGGETFLVSLSLALALSAEICARSLRPIEFFFLDEGFGTLDEHLIDVVMDSLERLRGEHFSIGIISHVEELKHRIERKLLVKKATEQHGSQIEME